MENISSLKSADRVEIFKHLSSNDSDNGVDLKILDSIACNNFHEFLDFCDKVFEEKDQIADISADIDPEDEKLQFRIKYLE